MTRRVWRAATDESAATAVEYAVMVALVAVVIIGGVTAVGDSVSGIFAGVDLESSETDDGGQSPGFEVAEEDTAQVSPVDAGDPEDDTVPEAGNSGNPHPTGGSQGDGQGDGQGGGQGGPPDEPPGRGGRP